MKEIEAQKLHHNLSITMPQVREKTAQPKLPKTCLKPTQRVMVSEINIDIYKNQGTIKFDNNEQIFQSKMMLY